MPAVVMASENPGGDFPARLTPQVIICSIIAACGGLMFGYDIGISGGVTSMDDFLKKFFPVVYEKKHRAREDNYCKYDDWNLQLFTSSLYLAAILCSLAASKFSNKFGRKLTIQLASLLFLIGVILNTAAINIAMLILGRILLGAGVGFGNQAVPLFISEIAPPKYRGGLNVLFQLMITIGIFGANMVNYVTSEVRPYGWRISLGAAAFPALILSLGSLIIIETPTSLIERNKFEEGRKALRKIRGVEDIEKEYGEIVHACEMAKQVKQPFWNLLKRKSRPQLVCSIALQFFQQFTGINVVMFYAPVLFQTVGFGNSGALLSSVIMGVINVLATFVAVYLVDKVGRRALLIEAAVQMFLAEICIGGILAAFLKSTNSLPKGLAGVVVGLVCVYVAGFAWSWGPMGWLIPSEIFPLETRNAGFFVAVGTNMICTFIIAQVFLSMLCRMKFWIFFFFAAFIVIMGLFAIFILPETKGIPIDEMTDKVWKKHWFWKRYFDEDEVAEELKEQKQNKKVQI